MTPLQEHALPTRAWMINTWKSTTWSPPADQTQWRQWKHMTTVVLDRDSDGRLMGETVWVLQGDQTTIGAAWEWIEWQPRVIILMDPMAIVSNVEVFGDPGAPISRPIALNTIAHALPWREQVLRTISEREQAFTWPMPCVPQSPRMRLAA